MCISPRNVGDSWLSTRDEYFTDFHGASICTAFGASHCGRSTLQRLRSTVNGVQPVPFARVAPATCQLTIPHAPCCGVHRRQREEQHSLTPRQSSPDSYRMRLSGGGRPTVACWILCTGVRDPFEDIYIVATSCVYRCPRHERVTRSRLGVCPTSSRSKMRSGVCSDMQTGTSATRTSSERDRLGGRRSNRDHLHIQRAAARCTSRRCRFRRSVEPGVYDGCHRGEQRVPRTDVHIKLPPNNAIEVIRVYRCPHLDAHHLVDQWRLVAHPDAGGRRHSDPGLA